MSGQAIDTKRRKDTGIRLTPRDQIVLRWSGEQEALRFDQAQRLMGKYSPKASEIQTPGVLSDSATRCRLRDFMQAGLIHYQKILVDAPGSFWLTAAGYRAAGLPFRVLVPKSDDLNHIYWSTQVRLWLLQNRPEYAAVWKSERWQRRELDQKIKQVDLPDAILPMPGGTIAVEVELSVKGDTRLTEVLRSRALVYDQVWYICSDESIKAVRTAHARLEPLYQQKVIIYETRQYLL